MTTAEVSLVVAIALNPVPASRPRVGKWGVHYLKTYATWMKMAAIKLKDFADATDEPYFPTGELAVMTEFVVQKARTSKKTSPRGDVDNYEKAAWDAITKCEAIWKDDDQIVMSLSFKRFTEPKEDPCTLVHIMSL